jgi:hypothetical protein
MAIYQAPKRRWRLAVASGVIGLLVGLLIGVVTGGGDDDPLAALRRLDAQLDEAAAPLDVLSIHGRSGTGSTDERVVDDAVRRTQQRFDDVRPAVRAIDPDVAKEFDDRVAELRRLAREHADPDDIARAAEELADLLRSVIRG